MAPAPLDPTVASRLSRLLKTRHECPPKEDFAALGIAAVAPELYRIARDPKVFPLYRFRALEALGYWPDDQVFELYVAVLASAVDDEPLQHDMIPLIQ